MRNTRIGTSLEELWEDPRDILTIRYRDLSEEKKRKTAEKIKDCAIQSTIRARATIDDIQEALMEINPIILEGGEILPQENRWRRWTKYRSFGVFYTKVLNGYRWRDLCQSVYVLTCLRRKPKEHEIVQMCRLTSSNHPKIENLIDRISGRVNTSRRNNQLLSNEQRLSPIEEITIEDINRATRNTESRNRGHIASVPELPDENDFIEIRTEMEYPNISIDDRRIGQSNTIERIIRTNNNN